MFSLWITHSQLFSDWAGKLKIFVRVATETSISMHDASVEFGTYFFSLFLQVIKNFIDGQF